MFIWRIKPEVSWHLSKRKAGLESGFYLILYNAWTLSLSDFLFLSSCVFKRLRSPWNSQHFYTHDPVSMIQYQLLQEKYLNINIFILGISNILLFCTKKPNSNKLPPWNSQHFYFHDPVSLIRYQLESQLQVKYLWSQLYNWP